MGVIKNILQNPSVTFFAPHMDVNASQINEKDDSGSLSQGGTTGERKINFAPF
jgi:hypothetical protein